MYAVEMRGITKQFKNVLANSNVDLLVQRGEIHSLLGENGAGKSTLMNILYGMYAPTSGEISVQGKPVKIENPLKAIELGIAMVHQHFMLIEPMTVAENVVLGYEPKKNGCFDFKKAVSDVEALAKEYGLYVDAREKVENLSVGTKQRVEILKALYRKAEILILDEPTAVLTPQEVTDLFKVLRRLKESGKTILIITHKLKETLALADTVTILRKGQVITSVSTKDVDESKLAELMVGRIVSFQAEKNEVPGEHKVVMALRDATVVKEKRNALDGVSLEIRAGEILGIAGVEGNGQTELIDALTGLQRLHSGSIELEGKALHAARITPRAMLEAGVGHIPEDRGKRGFVGSFTIAENIVLGYHRKREFSNHGLIRRPEGRRAVRRAHGLHPRHRWVALGRQPAEGHHRPRLCAGPQGHHRGAAHARRGHRRHRVHPRPDPEDARRGQGHPAHLRGSGGAHQALGRDRGALRGPHRGQAAGQGLRRKDAGRPDDGPRRGGRKGGVTR